MSTIDNVIDLQRNKHGAVTEPPALEFTEPLCVSQYDTNDAWVQWKLNGTPLERTSDPVIARRVIASYAGPDEISPIYADGFLWVYRRARGFWRVLPDDLVKQRIYSLDGALKVNNQSLTVGDAKVRSVLSCLKVLLAKPDDENPFNSASPGICFSNGFLSQGFELLPHSPGFYARWSIPCKYQPLDDQENKLRGSLLLKFLTGVFSKNSPGERADKLQLLGEHMFAALSGQAPRYGRALLLWGPGGTGKSQVLDLYESMFDADKVTSMPLKRFEDQQHRAELPLFALNACRELEDVTLAQLAPFKAIVHGEPVMAKAIYERPQRVTPRLAHVFAANDLPPAPTADTAFFDRWAILRFTRRFRSEPGEVPSIARKIIERERELLMAWVVSCGKELVQRGMYRLPDEHLRSVGAWQTESTSVGAWYDERCAPLTDGTPVQSWPDASEAFNRYVEYARAHQELPVTYREFRDRLTKRGIEFAKYSTARVGLRLLG